MTLLKSFLIAGMMLLSLLLAITLTPTEFLADELPPIQLAEAIPEKIGDWVELPNQAQAIIDPTQQEVINQLYSETLARSYVNNEGYVVMLSIAYGKSQQDGVEVHTPDVCYPAQGFQISNKVISELTLSAKYKIKTRVMLSTKNERVEPIIYWTTLGRNIYNSHWEKKVIEFKYSVENKIPDGMIVRVSSIDSDSSHALKMQSEFVKQLYNTMGSDKSMSRFFGELRI